MYNTVVCAIGRGSRERTQQLITAASMLVAPNGKLHLVHVLDGLASSSAFPDEWDMGVIADVEKTLVRALRSTGTSASVHVREGRPSEGVVALLNEVHADLVVIVSHRDDALEHVFGSVLDHVVRNAPCSIHILRTTA
ncbi:universal stress protein [Rhizobium tubonense]|uniref:Universal stress protein UspA n=1 Tax=Rhizobium tubonense TaxID=484088 RepID=A0A2W4CSK6_9HYPH|nr:universal stress protein [Rhizobium tubonense]PZM15392.1 universal stress protein UspA [Rhizobium tubonense]